MDYGSLARAALEARANAYAPYSGFQVGAALLGKNGKVYRGCNVENAAFGPTNCAERTALFSAVADGERAFEAIAVAGGKDGAAALEYCFPCGVCRQALAEFCPPEFPVIIAASGTDYKVCRLEELLPFAFGSRDLGR